MTGGEYTKVDIFTQMDVIVWVWLGVFIAFLLVELATSNLTTIWFAGGALVSLILAIFNCAIWLEIVVFIVTSLILLAVTRPLLMRVLKVGQAKTNIDGLIGQTARVIEEINNGKETGVAILNGQEWTARSEDKGIIITEDKMVEVVGISGVKLIVKKIEENMED